MLSVLSSIACTDRLVKKLHMDSMHFVIESRSDIMAMESIRIANRNAPVEMLKSTSTGK